MVFPHKGSHPFMLLTALPGLLLPVQAKYLGSPLANSLPKEPFLHIDPNFFSSHFCCSRSEDPNFPLRSHHVFTIKNHFSTTPNHYNTKRRPSTAHSSAPTTDTAARLLPRTSSPPLSSKPNPDVLPRTPHLSTAARSWSASAAGIR